MASDSDMKLKSIEPYSTPVGKRHGWLVTFTKDRGTPELELRFSTFVDDNTDERHIIDVARSHLAWTFEEVAAHHADWKVSKEERESFNLTG